MDEEAGASIERLILQRRKRKEGEKLFIGNLDLLREGLKGEAYVAVHSRNKNWGELYHSTSKLELQERMREKFPEDYHSIFIGRIKNYVARRKRKMMKNSPK